jgi:hypothetical protein
MARAKGSVETKMLLSNYYLRIKNVKKEFLSLEARHKICKP